MQFSCKVGDHNACFPVLIQSESVSRFVVSDSLTPWTVVQQAPLSMGFSKQKYPSGLPFPCPGDLPDPGIEPGAPALQEASLLSEPAGWETRESTAVRALGTSWAAGSRHHSSSHGTYTHAAMAKEEAVSRHVASGALLPSVPGHCVGLTLAS